MKNTHSLAYPSILLDSGASLPLALHFLWYSHSPISDKGENHSSGKSQHDLFVTFVWQMNESVKLRHQQDGEEIVTVSNELLTNTSVCSVILNRVINNLIKSVQPIFTCIELAGGNWLGYLLI